jgi:hypothetical protein
VGKTRRSWPRRWKKDGCSLAECSGRERIDE